MAKVMVHMNYRVLCPACPGMGKCGGGLHCCTPTQRMAGRHPKLRKANSRCYLESKRKTAWFSRLQIFYLFRCSAIQ